MGCLVKINGEEAGTQSKTGRDPKQAGRQNKGWIYGYRPLIYYEPKRV